MPLSHAPREPWRILVVEDDPIIAIMLGDMLHELNCHVVGPVGSVRCALTLIAAEAIDGAVLDWHLGSDTSAAIAVELLRRPTPFVFSTGYDPQAIGSRFSGVPVLAKPYLADSLKRVLLPLLRDGSS